MKLHDKNFQYHPRGRDLVQAERQWSVGLVLGLVGGGNEATTGRRPTIMHLTAAIISALQ
jgi:hypothetical protein